MPNQKKETEAPKKKILLAEDDKFISRAYQDGLGRAGFEVAAVPNGAVAMEKLKTWAPDLILLDLIMPEKDGFEVLEELKQDSGLSHIPVMILSNLGQETDIRKGRELGAKDYLIKSNYSMVEVVEKIRKALEKN